LATVVKVFERLQAMRAFNLRVALGVPVFALSIVASAAAQENLDSGKSAAQLYGSSCAICHKTPQGLAKAVGSFGLSNFLREHYTASKESAAAIAAYVESVDKGGTPQTTTSKRSAKPKKPKAGEAKTGARGAEPAPDQDKPAVKPAAKSDEAKPGATESNPAGTPASDTQAEAPKVPADMPAADSKPAPDKKSD